VGLAILAFLFSAKSTQFHIDRILVILLLNSRQDRQTAKTAKTATCRFNLAGSEKTIKTTSGGLGGLAVLSQNRSSLSKLKLK